MFSEPPRTGVPVPTPAGEDEADAAVVDEEPLPDEHPARALPVAPPARTTAPPAAAPRARKVRRLISLLLAH